MWLSLPENGDFAGAVPKTLIDTGLKAPQGIAVDKKRRRLYVADPDAQKIFAYQLSIVSGRLVADAEQITICSGIESRWVAVDGAGTIFFTDEPQNRILKVVADKAMRGMVTPEVVYSDAAEVNKPGGLAVDNFHVFWTNKHFGQEAGSLVRGSESPLSGGDATSLSILAKNSAKCYGVCIAMGNVFFTDSEKALYGVKKFGGPVAEVSGALSRPRGCAWDGDGTVYVADRGAGAVFSFASNMHVISETTLTKAFEIEDAFGLAVLTGAARHLFALPSALLAACLALLAAASAGLLEH